MVHRVLGGLLGLRRSLTCSNGLLVGVVGGGLRLLDALCGSCIDILQIAMVGGCLIFQLIRMLDQRSRLCANIVFCSATGERHDEKGCSPQQNF